MLVERAGEWDGGLACLKVRVDFGGSRGMVGGMLGW